MIWLNGTVRAAEGAISADDRGLLLGEAVFETILLKQGVAQFWSEHVARLQAACAHFGFAQTHNETELKQAVHDLCDTQPKAARQVLRITVTGGAGGRGLVPAEPSPPTWLVQLSAAPDPPPFLRLHISDSEQATASPSRGFKTTAYLDHIMARRQAIATGADEALLRNPHGRICGAAAGSLLVQSGRQLITPPLSEGALPGIMRAALLAQGHCAGLDITEGLVDIDLLHRADALFIANSVLEVVPAVLSTATHTPPESGLPTAGQKKQGHALCEALPQFNAF